jgi:hypothetical protein
MKKHCKNPFRDNRAIPDKGRGLKLLTQEIRKKLPPLYAQENEGSKAIAYLKLFAPGSSFAWYVVEGSPVTDDTGNELDIEFFALVEKPFKDIAYVALSEIERVGDSLGLPIELELHWQPKSLEQIAPELFRPSEEAEE